MWKSTYVKKYLCEKVPTYLLTHHTACLPVAYFVFQLQAVEIFTPYRDFFPCFANIAIFEDFQGCR